jgi:hypothetical protein
MTAVGQKWSFNDHAQSGEDSTAAGIDGGQGSNTAPDSGAAYLY